MACMGNQNPDPSCPQLSTKARWSYDLTPDMHRWQLRSNKLVSCCIKKGHKPERTTRLQRGPRHIEDPWSTSHTRGLHNSDQLQWSTLLDMQCSFFKRWAVCWMISWSLKMLDSWLNTAGWVVNSLAPQTQKLTADATKSNPVIPSQLIDWNLFKIQDPNVGRRRSQRQSNLWTSSCFILWWTKRWRRSHAKSIINYPQLHELHSIKIRKRPFCFHIASQSILRHQQSLQQVLLAHKLQSDVLLWE